jgi:hypothetical protein
MDLTDPTTQVLVNVIIALVTLIALVTHIASSVLAVRFGDMAAARHSERVTRQLEDERQERERLNVLQLLEQWVIAQWDTASVFVASPAEERLQLLAAGEPFDVTTLDMVLSQYVVDATEAELKMLVALRRRLVLVNRAAEPSAGGVHRIGQVYSTERVPKTLEDALVLIEDVHHWLRPKLSSDQAAAPRRAAARGRPANGA